MADQEQLGRLKAGVDGWNAWREEHRDVRVDMSRADLRGTDLSGVSLWGAGLVGCDLSGANLRGAILWGANLSEANLRGAGMEAANLRAVNLNGAYLMKVNLRQADLGLADLSEADLRGADLREANLRGVHLWGADLRATDLGRANLTSGRFSRTGLSDIDLADCIGLEAAVHHGPSPISTSTIQLSKGRIPEVFLRGCGLSDVDVEYAKLYNPDLSNEAISQIVYRIFDLRATRAVQVSPLFISYNHADGEFVDRMGERLTEAGVRYWRDVKDGTSGRLEKVVDRGMRQNPTVLLVLSERSVASDWVEHEARSARELEKELKRDVLCPIALDQSWKTCNWPKRLLEQIMEYHVLDFSKWKDDKEFERMFGKMISGLDMFYKKN